VKLSFEARRSMGEHPQQVTERRYEVELGWDASGADMVEAFAGFMLAGGYSAETVASCFQQWAEDHDDEEWDRDDDWDEFEEPSEEAEADEKTAPQDEES